MSIANESFVEDQEIHVHADAALEAEPSARSLFTRQTGQALVTLGTMFKFIPPFNDHIDKSTGQLLIAIGRKLKSTK